MRRLFISEEEGCYHIISRIVGGAFLLKSEDKDYFVNLLRRFGAGYFIKIHAFCVMDNHFHILATMSEKEALCATEEELAERLWVVNNGIVSAVNQKNKGLKFHFSDGLNIEKTRQRLVCLSRFVQDLKQTFSRYFNRKYERTGYLWGDRFKGILVTRGEAELACAAYIELNPVRAGVVKIPDEYRWCSMGLGYRSKRMQNSMISLPFYAQEQEKPWEWYKNFVYESGGLSVKGEEGGHTIESRFDFGENLRHRVRNFSNGLIFGAEEVIKRLQQNLQTRFLRKKIRACPLFGGISVTRIFKSP
jgi:REP element-mobilizing transposase RayT